jgi:hypothetical protein
MIMKAITRIINAVIAKPNKCIPIPINKNIDHDESTDTIANIPLSSMKNAPAIGPKPVAVDAKKKNGAIRKPKCSTCGHRPIALLDSKREVMDAK